MAVLFRTGQRLRIVEHGSRPELNGMTGTVVRLLRSTTHEAWTHMDADVPTSCKSFPPGDPRTNNLCLYDDEVEEVQ